MSRYFVRCPGCDGIFVARIGTQPTDLTKFYLPCPHCQLPIRGRMTGQELEDHRVTLDGEFVKESEAPADAPVVTIDPFVPSRYNADSFDGLGTFPTMTLLGVLGSDDFVEYMGDNSRATQTIDEVWGPTEMLFEYYLDANWMMFEKTATSKFGVDSVGATRHERSTLAYQALATVTAAAVGPSGTRGVKIWDRYSRKHLAATRNPAHRSLLMARDAGAAMLERDAFAVIGHFIDSFPAWTMGRLVRYAPASPLGDLTLFRDEFTLIRDLYQQGFELACKCLWMLVSAQNTVKSADPNTFDVHPAVISEKGRPRTLAQFDKLPNAFKIAYAAQVPGWDPLTDLLNNQRRNAIGHATARHDLRTGRILSDKDPHGVTYLEFLDETLGVFEALTTLMQVLRSVRVAASPDFTFNSAP